MMMVILGGIYFLPSIIAIIKKSEYVGLICVINLFLGITFIGWLTALYMALTMPSRALRIPPPPPAQGGYGYYGSDPSNVPPAGWR
ncbi:superinfection immunity protein [Neokomagataea tanensis]|uniref:Superinfection immunity protein n=1 Tax=Neokomagataea tanensis TaxID=661191 RepID=A0A4Y6VBM8_9PROT|nr:superinfection immunity protein [Neokomagataea tanensis]